MKSEKKIYKVKEMLEAHAHSCLALAEILTDDGRPLTPEDKSLVRVAFYQRLRKVLRGIEGAFLAGDVSNVEAISEELHQMLREANRY